MLGIDDNLLHERVRLGVHTHYETIEKYQASRRSIDLISRQNRSIFHAFKYKQNLIMKIPTKPLHQKNYMFRQKHVMIWKTNIERLQIIEPKS